MTDLYTIKDFKNELEDRTWSIPRIHNAINYKNVETAIEKLHKSIKETLRFWNKVGNANPFILNEISRTILAEPLTKETPE